jgi:hypothetical protein
MLVLKLSKIKRNSLNFKQKKNGYFYPFFLILKTYYNNYFVAGASAGAAAVVSTGATAAVSTGAVIVESTAASSAFGLQPKAITLPRSITTIKAIKAIFFKLMIPPYFFCD